MTEEPVVPPPQAPPTPLWRNRDYMLLWSGQVVSTLGSAISGIAAPLLILAITNSPAAAGLAAALGSLPYLFFSLPAGALVDRWNRKQVMIFCDAGRAVLAASIPLAMLFNVLTIWQLYAIALLDGTLFVFFNIAEVAAMPRVVPKAQLAAATAQNQSAFGTAGIVGPPVGGFLYQTFGAAVPFLFDAVSYAGSVISLLFIKTPFQMERAATPRNLRVEIMEGLRWLWRQPLIRFMAFLTGGLNFVNAAQGLIIIILAQQLGADAAQIGLIFTIGSIGAIVGSIIGAPIAKRFSFGQVIIATVWFQAVLFPLYAIAPHILILGLLSALAFITTPIYNVVQFSHRMALIPDALQGRVNSTFRLLAFGFQPLGAALAGVLLENIGSTSTVLAYGAIIFLLSIVVTFNTHVRNAQPIEQTSAA
ncbi:MAG TPA: MFS transporter [Chloroflexia bacterium]|nr:MFS transporter [Chloroflexia bacterium]